MKNIVLLLCLILLNLSSFGQEIPFEKIALSDSIAIAKQMQELAKRSRIVAVINVNKNSFTQINYGTEKDVNTESIHDAKIPLELKINSKTKLFIPVLNEK